MRQYYSWDRPPAHTVYADFLRTCSYLNHSWRVTSCLRFNIFTTWKCWESFKQASHRWRGGEDSATQRTCCLRGRLLSPTLVQTQQLGVRLLTLLAANHTGIISMLRTVTPQTRFPRRSEVRAKLQSTSIHKHQQSVAWYRLLRVIQNSLDSSVTSLTCGA